MAHFIKKILSRLATAFSKPNGYLQEHGYYVKNKHSRRNYGAFPFLPYSVADLFQDVPLQGRLFFVMKHGSTAHWATGKGANAILGRAPKGNPHKTRVQYVLQPETYNGDPIDFLVIDKSHHLDSVPHLLEHVSADGVVMTVFDEEIWKKPDFAFYGKFSDIMTGKGWKRLRFTNPAPGTDKLVCELWYRAANLFNI